MRGFVTVFLTSLALAWPAQAEGFLKKFGRALDQAGKNLQHELENRVSPGNLEPAGPADVRHGICLAVGRDGNILFRNRCRAEKSCSAAQDCKIAYRWPPRDLMEARWGDDKPLTFAGVAAKRIEYEGQSCLSIRDGATIFCFIDDDRGAASLLPGPPPQQDKTIAEEPATAGDETAAKDNRAAEIEAEKAESLRREAERERAKAELEAAARSRAAEAARQEAEAKAKLISELTDEADIDWFFKDKTLTTLAPVDAAQACRTFFLTRIMAVAHEAPADAVQAMHGRCAKQADSYGQRLVKLEAKRLAEPVLKAPATLEGLQQHNWFNTKPVDMKLFTPLQQERVGIEFDNAVQAHRRNAIKNAIETINTAFKSAVPLTESADAAWALCDLQGDPYTALVQTCTQRREEFGQRIQAARCSRAIAQSGATRGMLDMPLEASGPRYRLWSLRRVICTGVNNHPDFRITVGNGLIPLLTAPSLQVFDGKANKLLDVELRVSTLRDGRSFSQLLLDIATGENEREAPEKLVVENIRHAGRGVTWRDDRAVIGCVLGFIKCK